MQSANHRPGKLDTLSQHAVEANHRPEKLDTLSQHTLWKLTCIKEAAKAQNIGQAETVKYCHTTRRTGTRGAVQQAATTLQEAMQEAWSIELYQLSWELEDQ